MLLPERLGGGSMSETIFTSETNGDWGTAAIWSTDVVPDSDVANVMIATDVTIGLSEAFVAGSVDMARHLSRPR